MATYTVYLYCQECGSSHSVGLTVDSAAHLSPGLSLGATYEGLEIPPEFAALIGQVMVCPIWGVSIAQRDYHDIFLMRTT